MFMDNPPYNAIDGINNYDVDHCNCCSVTQATPSPSWWQVDLRENYTIYVVELYGRIDLGIFKIFIK
jgi:hypothetical protein